MRDISILREPLGVMYPGRLREAFEAVRRVVEPHVRPGDAPQELFSEQEAILITYGDTLKQSGEAPLVTLRRFAEEKLSEVFSGIHVLPFFPYSSDDGFSVTDYLSVNPDLGTWNDVEELARSFRLMIDFVLNHISAHSEWFRRYLAEDPAFEELAIEVDPSCDLSRVVRPRSTPLLTPFTKKSGKTVHLWTTFSADQIDLNYKTLKTLCRMLDVFLFYVKRGAAIVRLDAIAYLWKEIGTPCIHLPQTHAAVRLLRGILDLCAPHVLLITETNVPHRENVSYFGDGGNEAQLVYNFTLPPLLLHCFLRGEANQLSRWAGTLKAPSDRTTFFNFTASHDGIGVRPLEDVLPEAIPELVSLARRAGGLVTFRSNPDGSRSPYELNVTYVDAVLKAAGTENPDPFIASQAVPLVLPGVPAIYVHSLFGSRNWYEGVKQTGIARRINRRKLNASEVRRRLADPSSFAARVFKGLCRLLSVRRRQAAFHPNAAFRVLNIHPRVFAVHRERNGQRIYALTNLSAEPLKVSIPEEGLPKRAVDLLSSHTVDPSSIHLPPFGIAWITW